jgi:hypothetical protein
MATDEHKGSSTKDAVVALGRKVKSVLDTHQRPSVRILRDSPRSSQADLMHPEPPPAASEKKPSKGIWGSVTSFFGSDDDESIRKEHSNEYDADTVDLLDVVGQLPEITAPRY